MLCSWSARAVGTSAAAVGVLTVPIKGSRFSRYSSTRMFGVRDRHSLISAISHQREEYSRDAAE